MHPRRPKDICWHDVLAYCQSYSTPQRELLYRLERETHLKTMAPRMMAGPYQGQLLRFISWMVRPRRALELGTFTGYGALCLAEGLAEGGVLHTIEVNPEVVWLARKYFAEAGMNDRIRLHVGDAFEVVPALGGDFDLVFLDAGKRQYEAMYELVLPRVRPGGFVLADNVLWSGKVVVGHDDADTRALDAFNKKVAADPRVECLMLPVRDGLTLVRKKERAVREPCSGS